MIRHAKHCLIASAVITAATFALSPPAAAQQTGYMTAQCNVANAPAQMQVQYEFYGDVVISQSGTGGFGGAMNMGGGNIYWSGYMDTAFGRYVLNGENGFATAMPQGGVYSDSITLSVVFTDAQTFTLSDAYSGGAPLGICQISEVQ